jgi:hypothetical protein
MITVRDYFLSYDDAPQRDLRDEYPLLLTPEIEHNVEILLGPVNGLLTESGYHRKVSSGWRPGPYNAKTPNAARFSRHMTGQAVDLEDYDGLLKAWLVDYPQQLDRWGLWMEHPAATKGWVHLQSVPPASKRRVFYP